MTLLEWIFVRKISIWLVMGFCITLGLCLLINLPLTRKDLPQSSLLLGTASLGVVSNATVISDDADSWNIDDSERPAIAVDSAGTVHVVWHDSTDAAGGSDWEIMYSNYTAAGGWANATVISDDADLWNTGASYYPDIAVDGTGTVHVVWEDETNGPWGGGIVDWEIMYTNYTAGIGWANATVISDDGDAWNMEKSESSEIAVDGTGTVHVVWRDGTFGPWGGGPTDNEIMYSSHAAGVGWANATVISDDNDVWNDGQSYAPKIVVDGTGTVHVVWTDDTTGPWGSDFEIMYTNYTVGPGWANVTVVSDDASTWNWGSSTIPDILVDGAGTIHVAWHDGTTGPWGTDWEVMYSSHTAGAGWANATVLSDDDTDWNQESSYSPVIAVDGAGTVHVVWYDYYPGDWEIVYCAKKAGASWSNVTIISDDADLWNTGQSQRPDIAIDGAGTVHVVWQDDTFGPFVDNEIMYCKITKPPSPPTPPPIPGFELSSLTLIILGMATVYVFLRSNAKKRAFKSPH